MIKMANSLLIQLIVSLLLGGIAVFSYSPFDIWPLAFISFIGLLLLANQPSSKRAALIGFVWGIGYFVSGVHWVYVSIKQYGELTTVLSLVVLSLLIAYLSLYPMLFAILLRLCHKICPAYSFKQLIILAPLLWQITEFLRGTLLNGFAWLQLGYTQLNAPLNGLFPVIGINGVNLFFSICSGLFAYLIYHGIKYRKAVGHRPKLHNFSAICAILVIFFASFWLNKIHWTQIDTTRQTTITLAQGNIAQSLRWDSQQLDNTLNTYRSLTEQNMKSSDIVIWSEAAITDFEVNQQAYLIALDRYASANNTAVAVGIIDLERQFNDYQIYNALIVLGDNVPYQYPTRNRYLKHHLVPFGEYTPLESLLKPIANLLSVPMSSMTAGPTIQKPLEIKGFKFTTVICYEVILSNLVWQNFGTDTDFLLTVSNDAWFGDTIGPWQHLQMARARALEFGRTLLRSTNNGITVVINPQGTIIKQIPQFETMTLTTTVNPSIGLTPYAKWGNYPYYFALMVLAIIIILRRKH